MLTCALRPAETPARSTTRHVRAIRDNASMSDTELLDGISKWLETSGRAMELRVARKLRQAGAGPVQQSFAYADGNTGVQREGDVLAMFPWTGERATPCAIELVVECKSNVQHPWVAFYDHSIAKHGQLSDWSYYAHGAFNSLLAPLDELWAGELPFMVRQVATHLVTAHDDRNNHAGNAVRQVLAAASARRATYLDDHRAQVRRAVVVIPAVVTAAKLIACRLDSNDQVDLHEVPWAVVRGYRADGSACRVNVMHENYLDEFGATLDSRVREANEHSRTLH